MSRRQAIIGHLQLFGKILLKQLNQTYSHLQEQHPHSHPSSSSQSSSNIASSYLETTAGSRVVAVTTAASTDTGPRSGSGDLHQKQETQIFLPFIFPDTPSFIETSRSPAQALASQRQQAVHAQPQRPQTKLDRLPLVSTITGPRPSILPLSSIRHLISSIVSPSSSYSSSTSTTTSVTTTAPTNATTTATTTLLQGLVLNFRSPSHHQGFFILLPDMDQDLVLDLTPLIHSLYGDPDHISDEEQSIDTFLTIVLFEEDEVPKKSWTLTIPRPVGSVLPGPRILPGQERGRRGLFFDVNGSGIDGGGDMGLEVDRQSVLMLRHWVSALWNVYDRWDRYRERLHFNSIGNSDGGDGGDGGDGSSTIDNEYAMMDVESCTTEPRVSRLLRSLNRLNALAF